MLRSEQLQDHMALARASAVLEEVQPLPGTESELSRDDRDAQAGMRKSRADVGGHVIGAF